MEEERIIIIKNDEERMRRKCSLLLNEGGARNKWWCTPIRAPTVFLCFLAQTSVVLGHGQHQHLLQRQTLATCRYDLDCMENAFCWNQKACYCKDGYVVYRNNSNYHCLKDLGDKCEQDYECVSENTRCMEICKCKVDYVLSEDGTRCLKAANSVGEGCREDSQCQEFLQNTICQDNVCTCVEEYHRRGPVCVRDVGLGQRCVSHNECVTQTYKHSNSTDLMKVDCLNDRCTCAKDYIMSQELDDCIRYSESGATSLQTYRIFFLIIFANLSIWIMDKIKES
ncbi:hypothetical protein M0804_008851 [Polistes exclamans]|nr:hypothetical protein M0804_008851 [Polistes exclamans]